MLNRDQEREALQRTDGLILIIVALAIAMYAIGGRGGLDQPPPPNARYVALHEAGGPFLPTSR